MREILKPVTHLAILYAFYIFYCPTFQIASWSALVVKLWQQLIIFFRFTVAILFVYIGSRTPDGTWNQGWSNGPKIKSPSVFAAICDDQIRRDRCRKSPGVSPALFGMKRNPKSAREISVTMEEKGILKVRETLT